MAQEALPPAPDGTEPTGTPLIPEVMPPRRRKRQLDTLEDVRRCLARCLRGIEAGRYSPKQGGALIYGYKTMASLMVEMDAERRLAAMEEELARLKALRASPVRPAVVK